MVPVGKFGSFVLSVAAALVVGAAAFATPVRAADDPVYQLASDVDGLTAPVTAKELGNQRASGLEAESPQAPGGNDYAVILWDDRRPRTGQSPSESNFSAPSGGVGNVSVSSGH